MKRMVCLLMAALIGAALFTGCGGTGGNPGADSNLSAVVKTGGSTSVEKVMNALIYQFQDDNRDVTICFMAGMLFRSPMRRAVK